MGGHLLKDSVTLTVSYLTVKSVDAEIKLAILEKLIRELQALGDCIHFRFGNS